MHILELIIGLAALAFLGQLVFLEIRDRRRRQALAAYHQKIVGVVTDNLLMKALESQQLPSEADIDWELETQLIDNRHWQSALDGHLDNRAAISRDWLLKAFYTKVLESKVPDNLRRQAYQKLHAPPP